MLLKLLGANLATMTLLSQPPVSVHAFASKKIPDHLMKRFPLVDPTKKYVPTHGIHPNQFEKPVYDPHVRKTEREVPREPENTIHSTDMHEDDHKMHAAFYEEAKHQHGVSIRKRNRMDREEKERLIRKN